MVMAVSLPDVPRRARVRARPAAPRAPDSSTPITSSSSLQLAGDQPPQVERRMTARPSTANTTPAP